MMRAGGSSTGAAYAPASVIAVLANRMQRTEWRMAYAAPLICDLPRTSDSPLERKRRDLRREMKRPIPKFRFHYSFLSRNDDILYSVRISDCKRPSRYFSQSMNFPDPASVG
jgi:hypothetical protein